MSSRSAYAGRLAVSRRPTDLERAFAADSGVVGGVAPSPNHGARRGPLDAIILHYTGMPDAAQALAWLRNPASEVSSHYFIDGDGSALQLVAESRRAWHAGASFWKGERDMNSRSIGIEIANSGHAGGSPPFSVPQIDRVMALCRDIGARHGIKPERILAHSDIAPSRKQDPGEIFPWAALHRAGIGHWVRPSRIIAGEGLRRGDTGPAVTELQADLLHYGYEIEATGAFDAATEVVLRAFQRHFRPALVDGIADHSTRATLRELIAALPDRS